MTALAELWAGCERAVADLAIPVPFDIDAFVAALAERRGRRIRLVPVPMRPGMPCGALVSTDDTEWICYVADTSPLHAEHIVLHEIGHLVLDHPGAPLDGAASRLLVPDLAPALVRRVLGRTAYSDDNERQAELFASLVLARAGRAGPAARVRPDLADGLAGLSAAFGAPPRRRPRRGRRRG